MTRGQHESELILNLIHKTSKGKSESDLKESKRFLHSTQLWAAIVGSYMKDEDVYQTTDDAKC